MVYRILVLKDGQIIEQGSHKELLALDGTFASMWADQISSNDGISISGNSLKKEQSQSSFKRNGSIQGYDAELAAPVDDSLEGPSQTAEEPPLVEEAKDTPELAFVAKEKPVDENELEVATEEAEVKKDEEFVPVAKTASENRPIAFPSSSSSEELLPQAPKIHDSPKAAPIALESKPETPAPAPIAFPTESSTPEKPIPQVASPPGVTFGASAFSPPSRTETPDPDAEPKRKRISSQNFQRLARRISLTTRRQGSVSSMLPDILKRDQSPRVSTDEGGSSRGEGSSTLASESPVSSLRGDDKKLKKGKKDKKKKDSP